MLVKGSYSLHTGPGLSRAQSCLFAGYYDFRRAVTKHKPDYLFSIKYHVGNIARKTKETMYYMHIHVYSHLCIMLLLGV